jgi:hypothetical protein
MMRSAIDKRDVIISASLHEYVLGNCHKRRREIINRELGSGKTGAGFTKFRNHPQVSPYRREDHRL